MPLPGQPDDIPGMPEGYDDEDWYWSELGHLEDKYMWNTWGDNCPICNAMRGKVYTLDFWALVGIWPGFHHNCDCTMKKVPRDTPESDRDFFGTSIAGLREFWNPSPNLTWDFNFSISPWQNDIIKQIEKMHMMNGADTPIGEIIKNLGGSSFFSHRPIFGGDAVGFRILATQRHFQDIDGGFSGSKYFTPENITYIFEPLFRWFVKNFTLPETRKYNNDKYTQMNRTDTPSFLRPQTLRPWDPMQTYATEVE